MALNLEKKLDRFAPEETIKEAELTEEQKQKIVEIWRAAPKDNPPSILELTRIIFPHAILDGRSREGKLIRDFLASFGVKPPTQAHKIIGPYELTVAEKQYINDNIEHMEPLEICKTLWDSSTLLSKEGRALRAYIESLNLKPKPTDITVDIDSKIFTPPENYTECLRLVNRFNHDILSVADISERQKQGIFALKRFLHSPRLLKTISTFKDEENRNLFLSEFIRATYDKADLSVDELNLYISLCSCYPLEHIALAERESLSHQMEKELEERGKIYEATVKAIEAKNREYEDILKRQQSLSRELNGSRAKRMEKHKQANASFISIVEYVRDEKKRQRLIQYAEKGKRAVRGVTEELLTFKDIQAEIFGAAKLFEDEESSGS
jgi:hypothetical protein